ncbi:MAG TPA: site-2 protease family protein [Tepidiformaceae bacterium]
MLLHLRDFSNNPPALLAYLAAFVVAFVTGIAFHEFSHAWAANKLGDDTAARAGRLTLNPFAHLDPLGTVLLLLVGFGWGKPTPVNPYRLRHGPKTGNALVAAAGPVSNFFFAVVVALPLRLGWVTPLSDLGRISDASGQEIVGLFLEFIVLINVLLGTFNLIPIHPLDGFKVAVGVLPGELSHRLNSLAPWGPGILMTMIAIGWLTPYSPIAWLVGGMETQVLRVILPG